MLTTRYQYNNKKSVNNGLYYDMHHIDGKCYLTPVEGQKTKTQIKMPYVTFCKAVKDGYYTKIN